MQSQAEQSQAQNELDPNYISISSDRPNFRFGRTSAELSDKGEVQNFPTKNKSSAELSAELSAVLSAVP